MESRYIRSIHFSSILGTAVARFIRSTRSCFAAYSLINSFVRGKIDTKMFILSLYPFRGPGRCIINREKEGHVTTRLQNRKYISIYATIRKTQLYPIKISDVRMFEGGKGNERGRFENSSFHRAISELYTHS